MICGRKKKKQICDFQVVHFVRFQSGKIAANSFCSELNQGLQQRERQVSVDGVTLLV